MKPECTEAIERQRLIACICQHYSISALQFLSKFPSILQTAGGVDDDDGDIIGIVIGWETSGREDRRDFRAERLGRRRRDETGFAGAAVADDGDSDARAGAGG